MVVEGSVLFLFNSSKVSPCGVHGIKITGPNPSVTAFHQAIDDDPEKRKSTNVTLFECTIEKLIAEITPTICVTYDKKPVHITVLNSNNKNFSTIREISPPTWYDSYVPVVHNRKRQLKTLKRDNKFEKTSELPVISVPNMRSIFPKINNFIDDMKM